MAGDNIAAALTLTPRDDTGSNMPNVLASHCFLQVSVAGQPSRTIVIRLFRDACPKTCDNFSLLCSSPLKTSKSSPQPSYRGTEIHRIVDNFMVQGGDFNKFDGSGGYSPLTGSTFPDESHQIKHSRAGLVSMANRGPNTNGSQFFITLGPTQHLDGKHVCFGEVLKGMDVVEGMTLVEREGSRPISLQRIVITDCGVGKGEIEDSSSEDEDRKKKRKKKHKKKKKKHRRRDDDDSSYDRKRRKKHKRSRKYDSSSPSDSSSSDDDRRRKKKNRKSSADSDDDDRRRSKSKK
jgi:peptidyl-prolyl isomerase G (cyclophilin G)